MSNYSFESQTSPQTALWTRTLAKTVLTFQKMSSPSGHPPGLIGPHKYRATVQEYTRISSLLVRTKKSIFSLSIAKVLHPRANNAAVNSPVTNCRVFGFAVIALRAFITKKIQHSVFTPPREILGTVFWGHASPDWFAEETLNLFGQDLFALEMYCYTVKTRCLVSAWESCLCVSTE